VPLRARVAGERDPEVLAELAKGALLVPTAPLAGNAPRRVGQGEKAPRPGRGVANGTVASTTVP